MAIRTLSLTVVRPDDLLLLRLDLINVDLDDRQSLGGPKPGQPALVSGAPQAELIVHFQPQHVAEQAFWEVMTGADPPDVPGQPPTQPSPPSETPQAPGLVPSRLAGETRLAYTIPVGVTFPLTLVGVLEALKELPLTVTAVSRYGSPAQSTSSLFNILQNFFQTAPPAIVAPDPSETAIEAPYRLILSPDDQARWDHAVDAVAREGHTELWHTRLGSRRADGDPRVRAVWSTDFNAIPPKHTDDDPFRTSLDAADRNELVRLTSDYSIQNFTPTPVATRRLMLTSLGAWLDVEGDWEPPGSLTIQQWQHRATMGRDHFVRVVYAGYLFPFGHRASLVKVTERKFHQSDPQVPGFVAYDFQRMYIIVREPVRSYDARDIPFRTVEVKTRVTPDLAPPVSSQVDGQSPDAFWPMVGSGPIDFQFHLAGTDWEGREIEFTAPLIFVSQKVDVGDIKNVVNAYESQTDDRRKRPLGGQHMAFAPSLQSGDTTLEAASFTFGAREVVDGTIPHFLPTMAQAEVDIPAVKNLLGSKAFSTIEWEKTFSNPTIEQGTAIGNNGQVYARVVNNPKLVFPVEKAGGLLAPNIEIVGLSRSLGPVGGSADDTVNGNFDPKSVFPNVDLMGGLKLSDIVTSITFDNAVSTDSLPKLVTVVLANAVRTTYKWTLDLYSLKRTATGPGPVFTPTSQTDSLLTLESTVDKPLSGNAAPTFSTTGTLSNFSLTLLPSPAPAKLASINFKSVTFTAAPGKKVDTSVELAGITFLGFLEFVNELQNVIPMDGFNDPPSLDVDENGVNLGFSLGIPTIGIGVMTMQNVSLSAGFFLPLTSPAPPNSPMSFRFAFCERQQPFILTVTLFGGGGFFGITLGTAGVLILEAALEFGASIALNLGVASGQVTVMGGIYFQKNTTGFELSAYVRACGSLSVLGMITVSVEFYIGLTYASKGQEHGGHLYGQATMTVKIKIAFFSKSVDVTMERDLAGSDPTFHDLLSPGDWGLYCGAFDDYPKGVGD